MNLETAVKIKFEDYMICHEPDLTKERQYYIKFMVFELNGYDPDTQEVYYIINNNEGCSDFENDIIKAQVFLQGSIKWDGCSNWVFGAAPNGYMLHFCGAHSAASIGRLMRKLYDIGAELMTIQDKGMYEGLPPSSPRR